MKISRLATLLLSSVIAAAGLLPVTGCLTLNVNLSLPEAAVQRATDDFVRDLYRAKEKDSAPAAKPVEAPKPAALRLEDLLLPTAHAADSLKLDSPKALELRDKLAANVEEIIAQKRAGVLGESNDGMLVLKDAGKLKPLLQKKVQKLVSDENALRVQFYDEVLKSNGLESARLQGIKESFGRSFQSQSPSGTWMQDAEGKWGQKP
ncbi:MAG: YdbL family protein [Oligoflexia bacterium]|nr:YdbL family protein [Oligoflexia bacterium]